MTTDYRAMRLEALAEARDLHNDAGRFDVGMCLQQIRQLYDIPAGAPDAAAAWKRAQHKHQIADPDQLKDVPFGVPVFWLGGSSGHGHIAMRAGDRPGTHTRGVWSTDFARPGRLDRVDGALIGPRWRMTLVGWAEDLNGVRVYAPPPKPNRVTEARVHLAEAMRLLEATPADRTVAHNVSGELRELLERLPVR